MSYISAIQDSSGNTHDIKSKITNAIPYGTVDSTSTSTAYTATVDSITSLYSGVCVMLRNSVISSSSSGFTLNVNNLGAKPVYSSMADTTADTTIFDTDYTMLFVYDTERVSNGCWLCYKGAVSSVNGQTGDVELEVPPMMSLLAYGKSTWNDFITAYNSNSVVYCRASSNSNPASGSQTRMAFMAYVNNEASPTEVEFQYYRSVSSHSATQQGDQVYVYKLNSSKGWSVVVRESYSKIITGSGLTSTYANSAITLKHSNSVTGGTVGTSSSTSGSTLEVPYVTYDTEGHLTASGTHTHTVNSLPASAISSGTLDSARIPTATTDAIGGVKVDGSTIVITDGVISSTGGGGGSSSIVTTSVTIAVSDWSNNTCTKNVIGVTSSNNVVVTYAPESKSVYTASDIYCSSQGYNTLTFTCTTVPTNSVTVNVMIIDTVSVSNTI